MAEEQVEGPGHPAMCLWPVVTDPLLLCEEKMSHCAVVPRRNAWEPAVKTGAGVAGLGPGRSNIFFCVNDPGGVVTCGTLDRVSLRCGGRGRMDGPLTSDGLLRAGQKPGTEGPSRGHTAVTGFSG